MKFEIIARSSTLHVVGAQSLLIPLAPKLSLVTSLVPTPARELEIESRHKGENYGKQSELA